MRYRGNDYSVPTEYGYREVLVRGYVHEVAIACGAAEIARHPRPYEKEDFGYNPLHYLALLKRKVGALERGVIGFDAVKHLVLCRIERRPGDRPAWPSLPAGYRDFSDRAVPPAQEYRFVPRESEDRVRAGKDHRGTY